MHNEQQKPTIYDHHLAAVAEGWLPASALVKKPSGGYALATSAFIISGLQGAEELVFADNREMRGMAAIMAVAEVRRQLREGTDFYAS